MTEYEDRRGLSFAQAAYTFPTSIMARILDRCRVWTDLDDLSRQETNIRRWLVDMGDLEDDGLTCGGPGDRNWFRMTRQGERSLKILRRRDETHD